MCWGPSQAMRGTHQVAVRLAPTTHAKLLSAHQTRPDRLQPWLGGESEDSDEHEGPAQSEGGAEKATRGGDVHLQHPGWASLVDGVMPALQARLDAQGGSGRGGLGQAINMVLRSLSQVIFINNPVTGIFVLVAALYDSPYLAAAGLLGLVASTLASVYFGLPASARHGGLFGYNG